MPMRSLLATKKISPSDPAVDQAEALLALSFYHRSKGRYDAAMRFAQQGLELEYRCSDETLPTELQNKWGFKADIATFGWYSTDAHIRELAHQLGEELAVSRDFPSAARDIVWRGLFDHTKQLGDLAPSLCTYRIDFDAPVPYWPLNPTVCRIGADMLMNVRCVIPDNTRNFLCSLDENFQWEIIGEVDNPLPILHGRPLGIEDLRLWPMDGDTWFSATTRQANIQGWCEIVAGRLAGSKVAEWFTLKPAVPKRHEKNWIPISDGSGRFVYSCDPLVVTGFGLVGVSEFETPPVAARHWKGSSQAIPFDDGFLAIIHERPDQYKDPVVKKPPYRQRFVWFDAELRISKLSWGWEFGHNSAGEYVCGMCEHPDGDRLVISYGVLDREAWLATVKKTEIKSMLRDAK